VRTKSNRIFERCRAGKVALGVNVQTASAEVVEMAGAAGYDYVMLDWEHGSYGFDTLVSLIRASEAAGITPVVRIPHSDATTVCRVLDAGALGIIAPQISSVAQAREVMRAARYRTADTPEGERGACPSTRAAGHLCADWPGFVKESNDQVFLALGFESVEAIRQFPEIADAGRMDAVFIGAFDLAQSMGLSGQMYHPDVMAALQPLMDQARARRIPLFATLVSGNPEAASADIAQWIKAGAGIVNVVSDRRAIFQGLKGRLDATRTEN
jgi:4-hydroxy-2-oxoheptanedioate aldolase